MNERNLCTQRGIGLLKTDSIKSIVFLGNSETSGKMMAYIWSTNGKITQTIEVDSHSYELSKKIMKNILSSYKYTINKISSEEEIKKLTTESIKRRKEPIIFR